MTSQAAKDIIAAAKSGKLAELTKAKGDLENGGSDLIEVKDDAGKTALHIAAEEGHADLVKYLIACCFDDPNVYIDTQGTCDFNTNEFKQIK